MPVHAFPFFCADKMDLNGSICCWKIFIQKLFYHKHKSIIELHEWGSWTIRWMISFRFYGNMHSFLYKYSSTDSYVILVQHTLNLSDDNEWLYIIKTRKITHVLKMCWICHLFSTIFTQMFCQLKMLFYCCNESF